MFAFPHKNWEIIVGEPYCTKRPMDLCVPIIVKLVGKIMFFHWVSLLSLKVNLGLGLHISHVPNESRWLVLPLYFMHA